MNPSHNIIEHSSGNVFADLGLADADVHLVKAELATRIDAAFRQRGMTPADAGRVLGLSQSDFSRILRGNFREHTLDCLLRQLMALGCDIDIIIRQPPSSVESGRLSVTAEHSEMAKAVQ